MISNYPVVFAQAVVTKPVVYLLALVFAWYLFPSRVGSSTPFACYLSSNFYFFYFFLCLL